MINHLSLGIRSVAKSQKFYDAVMKPLGYKCLSESKESLGYGADAVVLWLGQTDHPVAPDMRSGLHLCFDAPTRKAVDAFHKAALAAGGKCNGEPGLRADYGENYYAAFVIDPDGYRLEAYCGR
jgi:catechol 2,3-dioxygenase-like lactoylglutathione lyase family enzyme